MGVQSLGLEDLLEEGMATHCSILAPRIPWTVEPGWLQSLGLQRVRHNYAMKTQQWPQDWIKDTILFLSIGTEDLLILSRNTLCLLYTLLPAFIIFCLAMA